MKDGVEKLLDILFDKNAREDERHDAAMCLYDYDDPRVENAFFSIGSDQNQPYILLEAAGDGIGEIWLRSKKFDLNKLDSLLKISRDIVIEKFNYKK